MNALEIEANLQGYNFTIRSLDTAEIYRSRFCIANTAHSSHRGKHWIVIYQPENEPLEFFDSLCRTPTHYGFDIKECKCTTRIIQKGGVLCGLFCIIYVKLRSQGYSLEQIEQWLTLSTPPVEITRLFSESSNS